MNDPVQLFQPLDGLEGDEQGDRVYHGGPEKPLHHYAAEHYPAWHDWHPGSPVRFAAGAFGENVSTHGMSGREVHVGDVFRVGETLLQVSQGRQPCLRLNLRLQRATRSSWSSDRVRRGHWRARSQPCSPTIPPRICVRNGWRTTFERQAASGQIEDWNMRLNGPPA